LKRLSFFKFGSLVIKLELVPFSCAKSAAGDGVAWGSALLLSPPISGVFELAKNMGNLADELKVKIGSELTIQKVV